jgi:hypothetical protein
MQRSENGAGLALSFAWIGAVGAWILVELCRLSSPDAPRESTLVAAILLTTTVVAGTFGWLIASRVTRGVAAGYFAFSLGTPFAGAVNGLIIATLWELFQRGRTWPTGMFDVMLGGTLFGGACGICYIPALLPVLIAYVRARRARPRTALHRSDRRAVAVVAAGVGAFALSFLLTPRHETPSVMSRWIVASAFVVGLFGLFADLLDYAHLRARVRDVRTLVPPDGEAIGTSAERVIDFGMGNEVSHVVLPARAAYRDVPRSAILVYGRSDRAIRALLFALALDATVAIAGAFFVVRS